MKRLALATFALVALAASASAQVIPPGTNPVPMGGAYNASPPTCVTGSACWIQVDVNGQLKVVGAFTSSGNTVVIGPTADGSAASTAPVLVSGTTDGTATGLVSIPKVSAGGLVSTDGSAVTQPVSIAAAPLNAIGITPTDRTITSATGASQTMIAANAARHSLTISNTGSSNCGVNPTGGTAVIGGAGTITLVPTGAYTPRIPTLSAVTVICTSGQPIYGDEN